jgi:thiamine kinase-like enzyme
MGRLVPYCWCRGCCGRLLLSLFLPLFLLRAKIPVEGWGAAQRRCRSGRRPLWTFGFKDERFPPPMVGQRVPAATSVLQPHSSRWRTGHRVARIVFCCHPATTTTSESLPWSSTLMQVFYALLDRAGVLDSPKKNRTTLPFRYDAMVDQEGAFCNHIYRIYVDDDDDFGCVNGTMTTPSATTTYIVKIFSTLALQRMQSIDECLRLHGCIGEQDLGPRVLATHTISRNDDDNDNNDNDAQRVVTAAVLMEECTGGTLQESDLHGNNNPSTTHLLLSDMGTALARLHNLPRCCRNQHLSVPSSSSSFLSERNMLFHSCEVMLSFCEASFTASNINSKASLPVNIGEVRNDYEHWKGRMQKELSEIDETSTGHGDLKFSNIMFHRRDSLEGHHGYNRKNPDESKVNKAPFRFIDLELAGRHYRSYDLAKLFRTNKATLHTKRNQHTLLLAYAEACKRDGTESSLAGEHGGPSCVHELERQIRLVAPMTWLEAAIFFLCMVALSDTDDMRRKWTALAWDRLENYRSSLRQVNLAD